MLNRAEDEGETTRPDENGVEVGILMAPDVGGPVVVDVRSLRESIEWATLG